MNKTLGACFPLPLGITRKKTLSLIHCAFSCELLDLISHSRERFAKLCEKCS